MMRFIRLDLSGMLLQTETETIFKDMNGKLFEMPRVVNKIACFQQFLFQHLFSLGRSAENMRRQQEARPKPTTSAITSS